MQMKVQTNITMNTGSCKLQVHKNIQSIGEILYEHRIYFNVDGAHTFGHNLVNLSNLQEDSYVFTDHKGLFGIPGTGSLYFSETETIGSVRLGGSGTDSFSLL